MTDSFSSKLEIEILAKRTLDTIRELFTIGNKTMSVGIIIGIGIGIAYAMGKTKTSLAKIFQK